MKHSIWNAPLLNSRAPKTKVGLWEMALGRFLVLLPLLSVIPMALGNILVGILLGKT